MPRALIASALPCALAVSACGGETTLRATGTERVPAAKADIDVEPEGAHRDVDVQVHDLPPPEELGEGFTRYGVWMARADGSTSWLGFLRYQSDIRYGDLETQAPFEPVTIIVSAESEAPTFGPSDAVVLRRALP